MELSSHSSTCDSIFLTDPYEKVLASAGAILPKRDAVDRRIVSQVRSGTGRIKLWPWLLDAAPDWWSHLFPGGWHPMGTTRMAEHPGSGVVDPNCRVFGLDNLFVAGGSVFPTGSYDSPTVTLVALAVRLAHHLKDTLLR